MLGLEFGSLARRSVLSAMGRKVLAESDLHVMARWLDLFASMFLPLCALCALCGFNSLSSPRLVTQRPIIVHLRSLTVTHGNSR